MLVVSSPIFVADTKIFRYDFVAPLKARRQISKKRCFEKYCSFDQARQVSALHGTP